MNDNYTNPIGVDISLLLLQLLITLPGGERPSVLTIMKYLSYHIFGIGNYRKIDYEKRSRWKIKIFSTSILQYGYFHFSRVWRGWRLGHQQLRYKVISPLAPLTFTLLTIAERLPDGNHFSHPLDTVLF